MYNPSAEADRIKYREALKEKNRKWRIQIDANTEQNDTFLFQNEDILMNTFSYDESSICSGNLDVGSTYANGVSFSLLNDGGRYANIDFTRAKLHVKIGLQVKDGGWVDIPMGVFFVTDCSKNRTTIAIKGLDWMYLLNESMDKITITPGDTPAVILQSIADKYHFEIEADTVNLLRAYSGKLPKMPGISEEVTCRDFIGYTAALFGKSARFNRSGLLEFFGISDTIYETDSDTRTELSLADYVVRPTKIILTDCNDEKYTSTGAGSGSDDYVIELQSNPLLINKTVTEFAYSNTHQALVKCPYTPYSCRVIGDPSLQCGDRIIHHRAQQNSVSSIITGFKFNFRGAAYLEAKGSAPQSNRQMTESAKRLVEVRQQAGKDLNDGLKNIEDMILKQSDFITSALGFYTHVEKDSDGNPIGLWLMDNKNVDEAKTIWKMGVNGIGVTHDGKDGALTSSWGANDSIVARLLTADMIRTGALKALDNKLSIDLNNGEMQTRTSKGNCTIEGNEITLEYNDTHTKPNTNTVVSVPVSYMRLSADEVPGDNAVNMTMNLSSKDGNVSTSFNQQFDYEPDTGKSGAASTFQIRSSQGVEIDKDFSVLDSIIYDNIKMKRKNTEFRNTGVDFIFSPRLLPNYTDSDNLLNGKNNGFEDGALSPWIPVKCSGGTPDVVSYQKHSGHSSCCICGQCHTVLRFPVKTPAEKMYIGFYLYTSNASAAYPLTLHANNTKIASFNLISGGWNYYSAIVPSNSERTLEFSYTSPYACYIDDVYLFKAGKYSKEQFDDFVRNKY